MLCSNNIYTWQYSKTKKNTLDLSKKQSTHLIIWSCSDFANIMASRISFEFIKLFLSSSLNLFFNFLNANLIVNKK